ncbi:uncharacterized protein PgNI_03264 [Pyricularia grisea]|uniref:Uncharacterized protein n=1 Tax=Pyricularia grisea TaxID=148305 RepID=A0A6P8BC52_PYRGI|nr:uncharacterized protein PgNI_03264 [Pyricularia grisea]TLD13267.1 hypothetical protein PgNI_03264 [Pyricularia grisea]
MGSNGSVIRAGVDLAGTWITLVSGASALALAQAE